MVYDKKYTDEMVAMTKRLVSIPSPTGFTARAAREISAILTELGYAPEITNRGNVLCKLGGEGSPLIIAAHFDTLGGIVRSLKPKGRVRIARVGGLAMGSYEAENCTLFTRDGQKISGTLQMNEPSVHVAGAALSEGKRTDAEMEVVLDCGANTPDELREMGVDTGDFVAFEPRFVEADGGYIKSRYLDDKAGSSVLLTYAKYLAESGERDKLPRAVYILFSSHEEVGTGAASGLPEATEFLSVDMGCVGADLRCTEKMVSICVSDGGGPYDYSMITRMKQICTDESLPYALDIYPYYGSDADAAMGSYHMRHGCIGPGVYASHGYERTHREGLEATLRLVAGYAALEPREVYDGE